MCSQACPETVQAAARRRGLEVDLKWERAKETMTHACGLPSAFESDPLRKKQQQQIRPNQTLTFLFKTQILARSRPTW